MRTRGTHQLRRVQAATTRAARRVILAAAFFGGVVGCGAPSPPHVLLVTLDTTRADHLSCYGYERETSPTLDRFAAESVRYTRAWSTSAWTLPAHASLFTGLFPAAHGAQFHVEGESVMGFRVRALDARFVTLAELLGERGYHTAAFVAGPWTTRRFGVLQGFQTIDDEVPALEGRGGGALTDRVLAWLETQGSSAPLFLFVNYFDPHYPYAPPEAFDRFPDAEEPLPANWLPAALSGGPVAESVRAGLVARYDGEIRAMDHQLGRLLEAWRERTVGAASLEIVTSDHGESFGEEGFYLHNGSLGEEAVRVALIVRYPDGRGAGTVEDQPIQLVDVFPLVAAELGIELPSQVQGVLPGERERAYLELLRNSFRVKRFGSRYDRDLVAVIEWPHKLVVPDSGSPVLYRIDGQGERRVEDEAGAAAALRTALDSHRQRIGVASDVERAEVDEETAESLRALGYLD